MTVSAVVNRNDLRVEFLQSPFAALRVNCAKDPGSSRGYGDQSELRGFFASLRMTAPAFPPLTEMEPSPLPALA